VEQRRLVRLRHELPRLVRGVPREQEAGALLELLRELVDRRLDEIDRFVVALLAVLSTTAAERILVICFSTASLASTRAVFICKAAASWSSSTLSMSFLNVHVGISKFDANAFASVSRADSAVEDSQVNLTVDAIGIMWSRR
jgi:hypothetical protein